ncbi:MAG: helix-hairpin-helix domain-containing protein [Deltaproteobacteria bacterium]
MVEDIGDLYQLSREDISKLDGFAKKSATQLYNAIQQAKRPSLDRFLYALGIRHVGRRMARVLAKRYQSLDALQKATRTELKNIEEIGPVIAGSVVRFFAEETNKRVLKRLEREGIQAKEMYEKKGNLPLEGKAFVFTGKLENYTRNEAQRRVEMLGGRSTSRVSGQTDYLVAGKHPGSKLEEAKSQELRIIDEEKFVALAQE